MHQKVNALFFLIYVQKGRFEKISSLTILLFFLVFIFSSPKIISLIFYIKIFLCYGPLPFFTHSTSLDCPTLNPLDYDSE
jgi:hypothetical protein